jgi:hypothetical protein
VPVSPQFPELFSLRDAGHCRLKIKPKPGPVAHACNPSYSGGRDQEDLGFKPAWANSSRKYLTQKGLVEWLKVSTLTSNTSTIKKKN